MQEVAEAEKSEDLSRSFHGGALNDEETIDDFDVGEEQMFGVGIGAMSGVPAIVDGDDADVEDDEEDEEEMLREAELAGRMYGTREDSGPTPLDPLYEVQEMGTLYEESHDEIETAESPYGVDDTAFYYDNQNSVSTYNDPDDTLPPGYAKRGSFKALRRSVRSNDSGGDRSASSLPTDVDETPSPRHSFTSKRRSSGSSVPNRSQNLRRSNVYRQTIKGSGESVASQESLSSGSSRRPVMPKLSVRFGTSRRSIRRGSARSSLSGENSTNSQSSMDISTAVDRLGSGDGQDWNQTIAAAAIVAASANAPATRKTYQYSKGEQVLVFLNLLNHQNRADDRNDFTISPVNEHGFPAGHGKTEAQRQGPFEFLICVVTNVHFDEDEKYYTVRRGDTGSEQRADSSVMAPIRDVVGIEMAYRAARRTRSSEAEMSTRQEKRLGPLQQCAKSMKGCLLWPVQFYRNEMVPLYVRGRARVKVVASHLLHGDTGYSFKVEFSGINFFVMCNFIYLFNDVFTLSFLPAKFDFKSTVVGLCVWIVLILELLFEGLIRPKDYDELRVSDRAFSPSTARNINTFHLCFESVALLLFLPNFPCLFNQEMCGDDIFFSGVYGAIHAITSDRGSEQAFGRFILGLTFLRVFSLVRHWKQMWLSHVFETEGPNSKVVRNLLMMGADKSGKIKRSLRRSKKKDDEDDDSVDDQRASSSSKSGNDEDQDLKNAANVGTALMIVNSHRVLVLLLVVVVIFPMIFSARTGNDVDNNLVELLQANNLQANTTADCDYLYAAVGAWLTGVATSFNQQKYLINEETAGTPVVWAQLLPVRCDWQRSDGVITDCDSYFIDDDNACGVWNGEADPDVASREFFADELGVRIGALQEYYASEEADFESVGNATLFLVKSINDHSQSIASTFRSLFLLEISMLLLILFGLTVMRGDAGRLVLEPLQRMLKIVVRYAENPLSQSLGKTKSSSSKKSGRSRNDSEQLGKFETEQLINAIAKIADLLRKCWGVAGAGIISSNLARTKDGKTVVFNPTVPGKRVYALFGFIAVKEFDMLLRNLESQVMVLLNDVARVVHDEVYRWALGDSGQCNKNLGAAFLMVFRIGDFSEVHDRQEKATNVVFQDVKQKAPKPRRRRPSQSGRSGVRRRTPVGSNGTLQLSSLPGIQTFADRALLGLLKSYAGVHRDDKLLTYKNDFRLTAGVGAFSVQIIYGMDAGWAVEGAVGSEYKIDATYLSPHVNMASRMMSASKQYGVTILLSQAVEELLSKQVRSQLRHLDTVFVKGSRVAQRIFTYDARSEGADFFLYARPGDQADLDAEAYTADVWKTDQDLIAMRQHVSEEFMTLFRRGIDYYLSGKWKEAIDTLKEADNNMIRSVIEEGYIETDVSEYGERIFDQNATDEEIVRIRAQYGDGACKNLVKYMERRNGTAPPDWKGVRALMSK